MNECKKQKFICNHMSKQNVSAYESCKKYIHEDKSNKSLKNLSNSFETLFKTLTH